MLYSVDITLPKLSVELKVSRLSKTSKTGLELGLLKDKVCTMELNQCNNQEKIHLTQLS